MHGHKVTYEAGVGRQPSLNLLSFMYTEVVHHQKNASLDGRKLLLQLGQKRKKLDLPLAYLGSSVNFARTGIKSGKQMHCSSTFILVLQACWQTGSGRERRSQAGTWLKISFFIKAENHLLPSERARVELYQGLDEVGKVGITRRFGGKPEMVSPRFELMGA